MWRLVVSLALFFNLGLSAKDDPVVFKSDVALTRIDAQVLDRDGRAITGLQVNDFVLRVDGKVVPIRNFASEDMPMDVLLLLDVSGSMEPHVERIASAAHQALNILAPQDRVAIMIFDTYTRVRLPFRSNHGEVTSELNHLLRSERFNGGTRITRAMLDAAEYMQKEARKDARRAIVILTDDQTQDEENESRVEAGLARANAVMSFLQAPYETPGVTGGGGRRRGTWGGGGGGVPGGIGFPGGGIGFPGGGGIPGRGGMGGYGGDPSHTAGTAQIANDSGGDTMQVDEASALEDTLARLRQRYALHFYMPESQSTDHRDVQVTLAQQSSILHHDAEIRYRRVYMAGGANANERAGATSVTRAHAPVADQTDSAAVADPSAPKRRRAAVNEEEGSRVTTLSEDPGSSPAQTTGKSAAQSAPVQEPSGTTAPHTGGWPRADQQPPKPE